MNYKIYDQLPQEAKKLELKFLWKNKVLKMNLMI